MTLLGKLGLSPESQALEGTPEEVDARVRAAHDAKLRPKRLEEARRVRAWREIEDDLVERQGGTVLVSASSDAIFRRFRGTTWVADSAVVMNDQVELAFTVGDNGELSFFEQLPGTWTQHIERKAERELAKAAPKPTPEWMKP